MGLLRFRCATQLILDYDLKDVIKANARAPGKPIWNEIEENQRRVVEVHGLPKTWRCHPRGYRRTVDACEPMGCHPT